MLLCMLHMFSSSMKKLFKKPFVHIGLKNVKCYCCIFKDRKVIYYVHQRSKCKIEPPSCSNTPSISLDSLSSSDNISHHNDDHQDKTEDLQIYCCCYHLLKSFLKK